MNTTPSLIRRICHSFCGAGVVALLWTGTLTASAQCLVDNITNIVWRADLHGALASQSYDRSVFPVVKRAKVRGADFLAFVLGRSAGPNEVLALNLDLAEGTTNIYLSVFNTSTLSNAVIISQPTNALTTLLIDCTNMSFAVDARLPALNANWLGGRLQLVGTGKLGANGAAPVKVKANGSGIWVDGRPGDLGGTTAVVTRTAIKIRGTPLRVQPPIVP